jgi:glutamate dehydrogenase/leucine dehydrogenase
MTSPGFKAVTQIERAIRAADRKPVEGRKRVVVAGRGNLGNRVHLNLYETGYEVCVDLLNGIGYPPNF